MPPSADEIQNKRFLTALRGYDKDEVHAYLGEVAAHLRALEDELAALRAVEKVEDVEVRPVDEPQRPAGLLSWLSPRRQSDTPR